MGLMPERSATLTPELPEYWAEATLALSARDKVMQDLIARVPGAQFRSRGDAFISLARSITGQQISVKAAESVWQKLLLAVGEIVPGAMVQADAQLLRECGFSRQKASYLKSLAEHFLHPEFDPQRWRGMDDEAIIEELISVKGIGRWTAQMFLIFHLLRPNVLPLDDIGLVRAISLHYNRGKPVTKLKMRSLAKRWQPWCTVATWYLWRSLDPIPVEY